MVTITLPRARLLGAGVGAVLLAGLLLWLPGPAQSQTGLGRVGYANMYAVQTRAKLYGEGLARLANQSQANEDRKAVESSWRFLTGEAARRAVALELVGRDRTAQEDSELRELRQQNSQLELEWLRLSAKTTFTDAELTRVAELQRTIDLRQREVRAAAEGLDADLLALREEITMEFNAALASALHRSAQKNQLEIVLASHVPTWQPSASGEGMGLYWENVVLYGGADVTDDVIATLNDPGPPPGLEGGTVNP